MKKTYLYMVVCAAALMMAGCAQDTTDANGNFPKAEKISIGAKIANPESGRTGLDEDYGDGIRAVYWEADDQVALIDDDNAVKILSLNPEEEMWGPDWAGYTMFYGEALVDFTTKKYPAVSPASVVVAGSKESISLNLPEVQTRVEGGDVLMYATNSQDDSTTIDGAYLEFVNLVGYLELQVVGNGSVSKVIVESASKKLSGAATLVPVYEAGELPELTVTGENTVSLVLAEAVALDASTPTSFFVSLPAGTYPAGDLTIKFETETGMLECVSSAEHVLEVSHIKPLTMTAASIEYIDLTAGDKYANSFIVSAEGDYSFAAKTKGGKTEYTNKALTVAIANGVDACCAWESNDGMVTDVVWDAATGKIKFHYNGTEGNALISLVDAEGYAVWSWHIWGTDVPAEQVIGNNTYMDRNLGAWDTPKDLADCVNFFHRDYNNEKGMPRAVGLIYEWGRPVPFPGMGRCHIRKTGTYPRETYGILFGNLLVQDYAGAANGKYGVTATYYFPGQSVLTKGGYTNNTGKSKNGVAYTNMFYYTGHKTDGDMNSIVAAQNVIQRPLYWYGVAGGAEEQWRFYGNDLFTDGYDFASTYSPWNYGEGAQSEKVFDVCPYGYHVPNGAETLADLKTLQFNWHKASSGGTPAAGFVTADTQIAAVHATTADGKFVWFPASGFRHAYGLGNDDYMIRLWCSSNNDKVTNVGFWHESTDATVPAATVVDSYKYHVEKAKTKGDSPTICQGFAVRCVKDK